MTSEEHAQEASPSSEPEQPVDESNGGPAAAREAPRRGSRVTPNRNGSLSPTPEEEEAAAGPVEDEEEEEDSFVSFAASGDIPTPPDGGWGWMVVFASFMIHIIADGITYSFGIFVVELMAAFGEGRGYVSFIPSILVGVTLGTGPIASVLVNRYGCRAVTIGGAIVAAGGLMVSAAAPGIGVLYVTIGVLTGLGFGFIYLPAIVSVSMYFEKKRAFATGIAVCGSGLGTFIMAPVTQGLIDSFEWTGAIIITGAIVLLCVLFGFLFKPLSTPASAEDAKEPAAAVHTEAQPGQEASSCSDARKESLDDGEPQATKFHVLPTIAEMNGNHMEVPPPELRLNGEALRPIAFQMTGGEGQYSDIARMALSHPVLSSTQATQKKTIQFGSHNRIYEKKAEEDRKRRSHSHHHHQHAMRYNPSAGVLFRKDIFYEGSLCNIPEYRNNPKRYSRQMARAQRDELESVLSSSKPAEFDIGSSLSSLGSGTHPGSNVSLSDSVEAPDRICGCIPASAESSKAFSRMMDLSLLKDSIFIMFAVSNFLTSVGFNVPYVYTVDRAVLLNIEEHKASFLLSVIGIANTLGRIVLGWISDKPWLNRLYTYNISLAICGLIMGLSNFCNSYTLQAVYCAIFGVTSGAYVGLTSVVLVDLLGLDKLTNAFGLLLLFQGIASVIGPPIIGGLFDVTGSYSFGFTFAGTMIFISGVMLFVLPWMQAKKARKMAAVVQPQQTQQA